MLKKIFIWSVSFLIAGTIAIFQRATGPTYPVKGKCFFEDKSIKYKFPRSCTVGFDDCVGKIYKPGLKGYVLYKRLGVEENYKKIEFVSDEGVSIFKLETNFPKAGKIEYDAYVLSEGKEFKINKDKVILRFKGYVPASILAAHIIFMFLFMIFSVYLFFENNFSNGINKKIFYLNYFFLIIGGFVLGPIVQYYAFDILWSGFPFGYDLTDNKVLLIFIAWTAVLFKIIKSKDYKKWLNLAFVFTIAVYLVPHSLLGSEYDYSAGKLTNVKN
ncbi:MAG: hypothetical protein AB1602_08740 [Elusimicrobiota bacterium]